MFTVGKIEPLTVQQAQPVNRWPWIVETADTEQLKLAATRYEKLRKLNPREFKELYQRNIKGEGSFDELVDKLGA